jgi:hypothetical protein
MGGAISWLRGGKEDTEKVLRELDDKIVVQKEALSGYIGAHRFLSGWLLKVFVPVQVALVAWFYLRTRPEAIVEQLRDAGVVLAWPVLFFALRKAVGTYYGARVRRDEAKLRALFDLQVKELRAIEDDPAFKRKMDLLQKYGRNVPAYAAPQTPVSQVRQRPVTSAAVTGGEAVARTVRPDEPPPIAPAPEVAAAAPVAVSALAVPSSPAAAPALGATSPRTPKVYTQPVERGRAPPQPPVLTPARGGGGGGFWQSLIDTVVGEGPALGEVLECSKCKALNGLVAKGSVPDVWVCKVCNAENKKPKVE